MASINRQQLDKKGFVILFAVLVSAIILLVSAGVIRAARKDTIIASYARESQKAFYAADSALECALFHDLSSDAIFSVGNTSTNNISCGGVDFQVGNFSGTTLGRLNTDGLNVIFNKGYFFSYFNEALVFGSGSDTGVESCAFVIVEKGNDTINSNFFIARITAVGFNTCITDNNGDSFKPDFSDPLLIERQVSVRYRIDQTPPPPII